ncbi:MAG: hypothetical protein AAFX87_01790 [Bacteroidota bacterium]
MSIDIFKRDLIKSTTDNKELNTITLKITRTTARSSALHALWITMLAGISYSCQPGYLNEKELQVYIQDTDNGLSRKKAFKGYEVQVTYRPQDLLIAQETSGKTEVPAQELERLTSKYEDYYYFILSLSRDNKEALYKTGGGYDQFSDMVQTLSFRMASHVNMTTAGQDTIEVADYVFPRAYGMGGATNLMFVFNKKEAEGDEWVQLNLKEFGLGLGNQNFRFRKEDLDEVPKIKFTGT